MDNFAIMLFLLPKPNHSIKGHGCPGPRLRAIHHRQLTATSAAQGSRYPQRDSLLVVGDDFPIFTACRAIAAPAALSSLGRELHVELRTQLKGIDIISAQILARSGERPTAALLSF